MLRAGPSRHRTSELRRGVALALAVLVATLTAQATTAAPAIDVCSLLPPGLPTVTPNEDNTGCTAYDHPWPNIEDAWTIGISWYGNVLGETPAEAVADVGTTYALPSTDAYGETAIEGDAIGIASGNDPKHGIFFARDLYYVILTGPPADAATGQAYARVIDQNILATMAPGCLVEGKVTDAAGGPVADVHVRLHAGAEQRDTATDASGDYQFPGISADKVSVELIPEAKDQLGASSRFQVYYQQRLGSLRTDEFAIAQGADCTRDFDLRNLEPYYTAKDPDAVLWPDLIEIYQQTWRSWRVAESMGAILDYGLPLGIFGWCDPSGPMLAGNGCPAVSATGNAFYVGSFVGQPAVSRPYIALNPAESTIAQLRLDQGIYHEFGHAFLADVLGNATYATPGRIAPHAGYYVNTDSGDSWIEGFADFYRLMVLKHMDGQPPRWYGENLELDKKPWLLLGKEEEWALAGLLLDFEDGPADYPLPRQVAMTVKRSVPSGGQLLVEAVAPLADVPEDTPVVARLVDATGAVVGQGASVVRPLSGSATGRAWIDLPDLPYATVEVFANVGATNGVPCGVPTPTGCDDDPIDLTLPELWTTIQDRRTSLSAYPYVATIQDLYLALGVAYGGDRDRDGVDDVAQIFVAHGFFGDTDGGASDRAFQRGEEIGATSHHGISYGGQGYASMVPRYNTQPAPERLAAIDTGEVDAEVIVNVRFPGASNDTLGYGYVAPQIDDRHVLLAFPPPGMDAKLTLIAVAEGYDPVRLGEIEADVFWIEAELHPDETYMSYQAVLTANPEEDPAENPSDFDIPFQLPLAYIVVAAVVLLVPAGIFVFRRRRARR